MPPSAGEATLFTVYADVLLTFSPPEHKPPHYRFEKGSYIYLYQKSPEGNGRIEIANNPGKQEQDAVAGSLDGAQITYSYKKATAFTLTPASGQSWKIPAFDPRGERKYMYPIQSVDIYFWSPEEALLCLQSLRAIGGIGNFNMEHVPTIGNDSEDTMSPIIERLEKAAISVQAQPRTDSTSTAPSVHRESASTNSYGSTPITASGDATAAFAPRPYNPAAPAAPEARVAREKTPPPLDAETGSGAMDSGGYFPQHNSQSYQQPALSHFQPPPTHIPSTLHNTQSYQQTSPAHSLAQRTSSFSPPPPSQLSSSPPPASAYQSAIQTPLPFSPLPAQTSFNTQAAYQQPHGSFSSFSQSQQQFHPMQAPHIPGLPPPPQSPGFQSSQQQVYPGQSIHVDQHQHQSYHQSPPPVASQQQQGFPPPPIPGQHSGYQGSPSVTQSQGYPPPPIGQPSQQQVPAGGYSSYSYGQQQAQQNYNSNAIHAQQYNPTEAEAAAHGAKPGQQQAGGWASRADKAEKSVGKFLKKLDKKF